MIINNSPVDLLQDQKWESVPWKTLQVGDIIRVSMLQFITYINPFKSILWLVNG